MKNNRAFLFLLIMALISPAMILICCVQREEEKSGIEITDMAGTKVVLNKTPSRAIFLAGESWVYALKIRDKVVAFSDLAKKNPVLLKIDPGVSDIPSVGDMSKINEEAILSLNPDLIILWDEPPSYRENAKKLERVGIPIVRIGYIESYPEDICKQVMILGEIFDAKDRAMKICDYIKKKWNELEQRKINKDVKVLYSFTTPTYIACNTSKQAYVTFINSAGGRVVSPKCNATWVQVSKEWIVEENPDIWIISYFAPYSEEDIKSEPAFKEINAVKRNAVYKESYMPMQFLEPYFLLTLSEYWEWINGEKPFDESEFLWQIYLT
ncbi:MAG: iron complex transport system substrate-binding protein [Archaeoglobaceae archaeon]|nr:iron complex transport system substrate-binding protein [Archaeoglobaceae archaeon]